MRIPSSGTEPSTNSEGLASDSPLAIVMFFYQRSEKTRRGGRARTVTAMYDSIPESDVSTFVFFRLPEMIEGEECSLLIDKSFCGVEGVVDALPSISASPWAFRIAANRRALISAFESLVGALGKLDSKFAGEA